MTAALFSRIDPLPPANLPRVAVVPFGSVRYGRARTKNRENNPMQSRVEPGSQHSCCAASGASKSIELKTQLALG